MTTWRGCVSRDPIEELDAKRQINSFIPKNINRNKYPIIADRNTYAFCVNNSIMHYDLLGRCVESPYFLPDAGDAVPEGEEISGSSCDAGHIGDTDFVDTTINCECNVNLGVLLYKCCQLLKLCDGKKSIFRTTYQCEGRGNVYRWVVTGNTTIQTCK